MLLFEISLLLALKHWFRLSQQQFTKSSLSVGTKNVSSEVVFPAVSEASALEPSDGNNAV